MQNILDVKIFEIDFTSNTSFNVLILILQKRLSGDGIHDVIVSDNQQLFQSFQLATCFRRKGIAHHRIIPCIAQI